MLTHTPGLALPAALTDRVLTAEALSFMKLLHQRFDGRRRDLLAARVARRRKIAQAGTVEIDLEAHQISADDRWHVPPAPADLVDRRVEITGPTDRRMVIGALSSGANGFMADFEDATSPTWRNLVTGQANLMDAIRRVIDFDDDTGRSHKLASTPAVLQVRPRGWHMEERHLREGSTPLSGSLVDVGLYLFHNGAELLTQGSGPYLYLPKLESYQEARLWRDVLDTAEEVLGLPSGSVRCTVLIETITAAFEMEQILYALGPHATALNAGRWDYLFSYIKTFRDAGGRFVLPDRDEVTMTAPFLRAYATELVRVCHRRGAHAIGGMAAFVPSRKDPKQTVEALERVRTDKRREAADGFDGTWVAHPDLIDVAATAFDEVLGDASNQLSAHAEDPKTVTADALLSLEGVAGQVTTAGLVRNVAVALFYLQAWLGGRGAVAINGMMEDLATAEIARAQVWQWLRNNVVLDDGTVVDTTTINAAINQEAARLDSDDERDDNRIAASTLLRQVLLDETFVDFLPDRAEELLDGAV